MKQYLTFVLLFGCLTVSAQTKPDTLTNQNIIQLHNLGISDNSKISFSSKKIKPGTYEVSFSAALAPGEYCFLPAVSGMGNKAYDFTIKK